MGDGFGVIFRNQYLRSIAPCTATWNLCSNVGGAVGILFLTRELDLTPGELGAIFSVGSVGALAGATLAPRFAERFGLGPAIMGGVFVSNLAALIVPLFAQPGLAAYGVLVIAQASGAVAALTYNVNQLSLRQSITPHHLQGRTNAAQRFLVWGTIPIGALIGGFLGEQIGLRPTMLVGALVGMFSVTWIFLSPVRTLREQPSF
jgi:MFS family permease